MIQFILGGARSGKSRIAETLAIATALPVTYIATAEVRDAEMEQRVKHHQSQRPKEWQVIEEPIRLAESIKSIDQPNHFILVDCLTLWMSNLLLQSDPAIQKNECDKLLSVIPTLQSDIILVSNETGLGVVPMGEITRKFVDESGRLHQHIGQIAHKVIFCVAGFPMILKGIEK